MEKKYTLTTAELVKAMKKCEREAKKRGKFVGIVGGFPMYANEKVPPGEIWIKSGESVEKFFITDLDKPRKKWWQFWKKGQDARA